MATRRPHTKSRLGCLRCKQKHLKCDEVRPTCGTCARYQVPCIPAPIKPTASARFKPGSPRARSIIRSPRPLLPPPAVTQPVSCQIATLTNASPQASESMLPLFPPFPLGPTTPRSPYETSHTATQRPALTLWEFELLHHWILDVADSFDVSPGFHRAWRDQAIRAALQHEYLLHVILVLSALHLALTDSPSFTDRHRGLIVRGCSDAMATFRKEAEHVTEVNCHALTAFAFLVSVYAFALAQFDRADHHDHHCSHQPPPPPHRVDQDQEHKQQEQNILDETIGTLVLIKGTVVVGDSTKPLAEASGRPWVANADILAPPLGEFASPSEDQDLHRALEDLQAWIDHAARGRGSGKHQGEEGGGPPTSTPRPITTTTSHQALRLLRETLAANLRSNLRPFAWPCTLDENYLDLLRARDPTALLILAHYAVILVQCRAQWWCAGWGARVIAGVAELLPEGLAGPLAYPLHVIGRG